MAVINLKDIIKYLIKITFVIVAVIGLTKYFSSNKENVTKQVQKIDGSTLLSCLDTTIPGIRSINKKEKSQSKSQKNPLKDALTIQLGMLSSVRTENIPSKKQDENSIRRRK